MTKTERAAHQARMIELHEKARAIVATGKCPDCGEALRHNNAMRGWWQCAQFGAEGFRVRPADPSCHFQTFTD